MKKAIDLFSKQAGMYNKYRPLYPKELYDEILGLTKNHYCCLDCGTGNGQVSRYMADHFKKVYATDISENQLKRAEKKQNIRYIKERAEVTSFQNNQFDLITIAQAVHWFDLKPFYQEVRRIAKNNAIIAIWGYGLLKIGAPYDKLIKHFYHKTVGPYWNEQRKHIDSQYKSIDFPFEEIKLSRAYQIEQYMSLSELDGYFNSWSSVQNYLQSKKTNPVSGLVDELSNYWEDSRAVKKVRYPIFAKIGIIRK